MYKTMNDDFPNEIDLGREIKDAPMPATTDGKPSGKKAKSRVSYPTVYLSGVEGLRDLPKDGWALINFHRNRVGIVDREGGDNGPLGGNGDEAEIEIRKLCLPEAGGSGDDDGEDTASAFAKFAKENGVSDATEAEDSADEESPDEEQD